ncbi:MAG: 4Fe-4S dicluster domain-containing protein [Actinomycetota bacterium]|nr:4Fe-4S dicluster domain-containing protein [Actinomycetota bacterium]
MVTKILSAGNLQAWLDSLVAAYQVYAPVEGEGASSFKKIAKGQMPAMDIRTDTPPKGLIFKQVEKILSFEVNPDGITVIPGDENGTKKIVFGIRPCDSRSFTLTDKPFFDPNLPENQYMGHRNASALVTTACTSACRTCFCTSIGGAPDEKTGDVWMMDIDGKYLVESLTDKGEELIKANEGLFSDASADDEAAAKRIGEEVANSMPKINIADAKALDALFNDDAFWQKLTDKCLSCGACTFVCPTCYCFDVRDEGNTRKGERYRGWDSCMFYQYNRAAGGHNPREFHWKRMRQRMLHKFSYFPEKYGDIDCVGCGRCIRSCPVSYDLRDFLEGSLAVTGAAPVGFEKELSDVDTKDRSCEIKPADETVKTGGGL